MNDYRTTIQKWSNRYFANCMDFINEFASENFNKQTGIDNDASMKCGMKDFIKLAKDNKSNKTDKITDGVFVSLGRPERNAHHVGIIYGGKILHYLDHVLYWHDINSINKCKMEIKGFYVGFEL